MGLTCNIDERGQRVRRNAGVGMLLLGVILVAVAWWFSIMLLEIGAFVLLISGAFCLFEAHNKWCAVRAMGIKTKI